MLQTTAVLAVLAVLIAKYVKAQAIAVKTENKAIENTYYALLDRKAFAQEASAQDEEVYKLAVKIAKR